MVYKILRKAGLGGYALRLIRPFLKDCGPMCHPDEARALLHSLNEDKGGSCLWDKRRAKGDTELDIIIPAYNAENYIKACLDSALSQDTKHSFRLIVIDDGSTDSTGSIIDSYAADPHLLIRHQENRGFSGARNAGLEISDAKFVMFLDSDDTLPPGCIEAMLSCAELNSAAIVEGGYCTVSPEGKLLSRIRHKAGRLEPATELKGFTAMKIIAAELIDGICFPEGYWYEDSIMAQIINPLCQSRGLRAWGIGESVYNYTVNPGGISHTGRKSPKSIDSLYVTMRLFEDRKKLGLEKTQDYYDYILNMVILSFRRCENQSEEVKEAMFVLWRDFLQREFDGFDTEHKGRRTVQFALRSGNYPMYCAACKLI